MSPLEIEEFNPRKRQWSRIASIDSSDKSCVMQSLTPDGAVELYRFSCSGDNTQSVIEKNSGRVMDRGYGIKTVKDRWEEVTRLQKRQTFELLVRGERNSITRRLRLTHKP